MNPNKDMLDAANDGDIDRLRKAIDAGADPKSFNSTALRKAARAGRAECVRFLIPISDPAAESSLALVHASQFGHGECVRLLVPVSDVDAVRKTLTTAQLMAGISLLDSVIQEDELRAKHLKSEDGKARVSL